jgi:hypothetical protein
MVRNICNGGLANVGPMSGEDASVKDWEIIADNLKKHGWSWGCVSAIDANGQTIWIADAHCGDGITATVTISRIRRGGTAPGMILMKGCS